MLCTLTYVETYVGINIQIDVKYRTLVISRSTPHCAKYTRTNLSVETMMPYRAAILACAAVATLLAVASSPQPASAFSSSLTGLRIVHRPRAGASLSSMVVLQASPVMACAPDDDDDDRPSSSRRALLLFASAAAAGAVVLPARPSLAAAATTTARESLIADLDTSLERISTIPPLLESAQWDKVRTVLKTPPVNQLWNLGDAQNTLARLAKETGEMEMMDMKDELAISLQMTDQYSYDNNFIYYQPGKFTPHFRFFFPVILSIFSRGIRRVWVASRANSWGVVWRGVAWRGVVAEETLIAPPSFHICRPPPCLTPLPPLPCRFYFVPFVVVRRMPARILTASIVDVI